MSSFLACACMRACMRVCVRARARVCACLCLCSYAHMYVCCVYQELERCKGELAAAQEDAKVIFVAIHLLTCIHIQPASTPPPVRHIPHSSGEQCHPVFFHVSLFGGLLRVCNDFTGPPAAQGGSTGRSSEAGACDRREGCSDAGIGREVRREAEKRLTRPSAGAGARVVFYISLIAY